jgi:hypothetical protein
MRKEAEGLRLLLAQAEAGAGDALTRCAELKRGGSRGNAQAASALERLQSQLQVGWLALDVCVKERGCGGVWLRRHTPAKAVTGGLDMCPSRMLAAAPHSPSTSPSLISLSLVSLR